MRFLELLQGDLPALHPSGERLHDRTFLATCPFSVTRRFEVFEKRCNVRIGKAYRGVFLRWLDNCGDLQIVSPLPSMLASYFKRRLCRVGVYCGDLLELVEIESAA